MWGIIAIVGFLSVAATYLLMGGGAKLNDREDRARAEAEYWTNQER